MNELRNRSPRVSIVIPAYNNEPFIAATLESVLAQTYEDYEVVVADHSSSDRTAEVIAKFAADPRLRILEPTPAGGGAQANWNRVTTEARGELVNLVCCDDLLEPSALSKQVAAFDENPGISMTASARSLIDAAGKVIIAKRGLAGLQGRVGGKDAIRRSVLAGTNIFGEPVCVLFRKRAWEQAGRWDDRFPYLIDQYSYAGILLQGDMVALSEPLASFRISSAQWSVRLVKEQAIQAAAFHQYMKSCCPGLLSSADVVAGNIKAHMTAWMRRVAYLWLRHRM